MHTHTSSGAIILREQDNRLEVLVMHRHLEDSWHLPKGTQETGETLEETAVREVKEETGLEIELGPYVGNLPSTFVRNGKTIHKTTHYYLAKPNSDIGAHHDEEHDMVCFLNIRDAIQKLKQKSVYEEEWKIVSTVHTEKRNA